MGAIVDILLLDPDNTDLLKKQYPGCVLTNLSNTAHRLQEYKLIVPELDLYDDSYYFFLYDNLIAMSSRNFLARFEYDKHFRDTIRARADATRRGISAGNAEAGEAGS